MSISELTLPWRVGSAHIASAPAVTLPWPTFAAASRAAPWLRHGGLVSVRASGDGGELDRAPQCTATLLVVVDVDGDGGAPADARVVVTPDVAATLADQPAQRSSVARPLRLFPVAERDVAVAVAASVALVAPAARLDIDAYLSAPDLRLQLDPVRPPRHEPPAAAIATPARRRGTGTPAEVPTATVSGAAAGAAPAPAAAAATASTLAVLLDGVIVHDGQSLDVPWFGARRRAPSGGIAPVVRVRVRVAAAPALAADAVESPPLPPPQPLRIRAGITAVGVHFENSVTSSVLDCPAATYPASLSAPPSARLWATSREWARRAEAIVPGHDAPVRALIALASSVFSQCAEAAAAPQPAVPGCADSGRGCYGGRGGGGGGRGGGSDAAAVALCGPTGALLCGGAGTGKSSIVAAVASGGGAALVRVTPSALYQSAVGATEAAIDDLVRRLAWAGHRGPPTVVVLEDAEVLFPAGGRGGRGAPSPFVSRVARALLAAIRDTRARAAPVFWVGVTSAPLALSAAATSAGHMDAIVTVGMPTGTERAAMLGALTGRRGPPTEATCGVAGVTRAARVPFDDSDASVAAVAAAAGGGGAAPFGAAAAARLQPRGSALLAAVARRTHGYTAADLAEVVREAATRAAASAAPHAPPPAVSGVHFAAALAAVPPSLLAEAVGRPPPASALADIVGAPAAVAAAVAAVLTPLRRAAAYARLGVSPPRGLLLHGPPGTGKTALAHALAAEAARAGLARALVVTSTDIVGSLVGSSEAALAATFERARELAPCILVLDQFECIAAARAGAAGGRAAAAAAEPEDDVSGASDGDAESGGEDATSDGAGGDGLGVALPRRRRGNGNRQSPPPPPSAAAAQTGDRLLSVLLMEMDGLYSGAQRRRRRRRDADAAGGGGLGAASSALAHPLCVADALESAVFGADFESDADDADDAGPGGVFVIAVTVDREALDPAVLRPGRLDVHVGLQLPDAPARAALLRHFFARSPTRSCVDPARAHAGARAGDATGVLGEPSEPPSCAWDRVMDAVAEATHGWSPADLEGLWRDAAMGALRRSMGAGDAPPPAATAGDAAAAPAAITEDDVYAALSGLTQRLQPRI